jgi:hypothetical protein
VRRTRKPLGLKPVDDDDDRRSADNDAPVFWPGILRDLPPKEANVPATMEVIYSMVDLTMEATLERVAPLRQELTAVKAENSKLRIALAEAVSKISELDFVVERLKIENKGPPGAQGLRGRDGRDGAEGPRGFRGEKGDPGVAIAAWRIDASNYVVTPVLGDGTTAPALNLRALMEQFYLDSAATDEVAEAEAALDERMARQAEIARQMANVRNGRPPSAR